MNNANLVNCRYRVAASGNSDFYRAVSIPLAEALEHDLKRDDSATVANDLPDYIDISSEPMADGAVLIGGIVGVFAFFASWLATRLLDDIYESRFQPAIRRALGTADQRMHGANASKSKVLQVGISYADKRVFILIAIIAETFADVLNSEHMIKTVHHNAVLWIENNAFTEPIHLYIVNRGSVNLEPRLFNSLMLAHQHIRSIDINSHQR
jgi:hypothetical protein